MRIQVDTDQIFDDELGHDLQEKLERFLVEDNRKLSLNFGEKIQSAAYSFKCKGKRKQTNRQ